MHFQVIMQEFWVITGIITLILLKGIILSSMCRKLSGGKTQLLCCWLQNFWRIFTIDCFTFLRDYFLSCIKLQLSLCFIYIFSFPSYLFFDWYISFFSRQYSFLLFSWVVFLPGVTLSFPIGNFQSGSFFIGGGFHLFLESGFSFSIVLLLLLLLLLLFSGQFFYFSIGSFHSFLYVVFNLLTHFSHLFFPFPIVSFCTFFSFFWSMLFVLSIFYLRFPLFYKFFFTNHYFMVEFFLFVWFIPFFLSFFLSFFVSYHFFSTIELFLMESIDNCNGAHHAIIIFYIINHMSYTSYT